MPSWCSAFPAKRARHAAPLQRWRDGNFYYGFFSGMKKNDPAGIPPGAVILFEPQAARDVSGVNENIASCEGEVKLGFAVWWGVCARGENNVRSTKQAPIQGRVCMAHQTHSILFS